MTVFTTTGDEALATIRKSAEATRRPGETPEQAFTRYLEGHPGVVAELGRQAALAKRRAVGPLATLPDPAYDKLMEAAKRMVDQNKAPTVPQAFAKLYEARDPDVRRLVKAAKARTAVALGAADEATDDDAHDAPWIDPVDTGDLDFDDADAGGDLDNRGTQGATGQGRNRGRAKMFSELVPPAKPVATARNQGSYDPKRRPASATRAAPTRVTVSDYGRPEPWSVGKLAIRKVTSGTEYPELATLGTDVDPVVKRARKLVVKGFNSHEAMYISAAPSKRERRALRKQIESQRARAVSAQNARAA